MFKYVPYLLLLIGDIKRKIYIGSNVDKYVKENYVVTKWENGDTLIKKSNYFDSFIDS